MIRRDALLVVVVVVVGLVLGVVAATQRDALDEIGDKLSVRPTPPRLNPMVRVDAERRELTDLLAADRALLPEIRALVREGRLDEALARARSALAAQGPTQGSLLRVEIAALEHLQDPATLDVEACQAAATDLMPIAYSARGITSSAAAGALLLADVPDGLGDPVHPGHAHARAFVTCVLAGNGSSFRAPLLAPIARLVNDDADALVAVLGSWASLRRWRTVADSEREHDLAPRSICVEICQAIATQCVPESICHGLAAIAREVDRPTQERALAAMALAELADLPVGLDARLPSDDEGAAGDPIDETVAAWELVRVLPPAAAFAARVELALDPDHGSSFWLSRRIGQDATRETARRIASGELGADQHLASLVRPGPDADARDVLRAMESDWLLRIPLHHLLTIREAAGPGRSPRWTASAHPNGLVIRWREALGLAAAPWTLRVARLERRIGSTTLVDETRRTLRGDGVESFAWETSFDDPPREPVRWIVPGALPAPTPAATLSGSLDVRFAWTDEGAEVTLDRLRFDLHRAGGWHNGGTSSHASRPAGLPFAIAPWADHADAATSRRVFLVVAQEGDSTGSPWSLDDWRRATQVAFAAAQQHPDFGEPGSERRLLRLASALSRLGVEVDVDSVEPRLRDALARWQARAATGGGTPRTWGEFLASPPEGETISVVPESALSEPVARELLAFAEAHPGRVPPAAIAAATQLVEKGDAPIRRRTWRVIAGWGALLLLLGIAAWGRGRPRRGRVTAALALAVAVVGTPYVVPVDGIDLVPDWAGWGAAAGAVWLLGADTTGRTRTIATGAFATAAVAALLPSTLTSAMSVAAVLVGCLATAALAPALVEDLTAQEPRRLPRRSGGGGRKMLAVRAGLATVVSLGVLGSAAMRGPGVLATVAAYYVPIALTIGGLLSWRLALSRSDEARALPPLFVVALALPTAVLLGGSVSARLQADPRPFDLPEPIGSVLTTWVVCALAFLLWRLLDAARVRARTEGDDAIRMDVAAHADDLRTERLARQHARSARRAR